MAARIRPWLVLIGVCGVFFGIEAVLWPLEDTRLMAWQSRLHWNYLSHVLFVIVPAVAFVVLRRRPDDYALKSRNLPREAALGAMAAGLLFLVPLVAEALFGTLELKRHELGFILSTVVFQMVFSGFGEELLFRGFFQGELNRAFGKPYTVLKTPFGWGLIITALLFGIAHLTDPFNPLHGRWELAWGFFAVTTIYGFIFGFIREYFGGIVAVSLIHGGGNLYFSLFKETSAGQIGTGIAIGITCFLFALRGAEGKKRAESKSGA
jgi:membrane protease YdiL (CAAX protease family)